MADHDLAAERAALGAVIVDPSLFTTAAAVVAPADFYRVAHRHVWTALAKLHADGTAIDPLTVRAAVEGAGHLDEVTPLYLAQLTDGVPRASNVAYYAGIVAEKAKARDVVRAMARASAAVVEHGATAETLAPVTAAVSRATARRGAAALELTGVADLLAEGDNAIEWVVEDRFAFGSVNLLAGRPKAGKSTLARALALAVARGDRWLGSRCRFGAVVYVALEDKRSEVRRHLQRMGATGAESIRFLIGSAPRTLLADLDALIQSGDTIDLLIIDTAQKLLAVKDTNDYAQVTAAFAPVLDLARTRGTCIVLVHHAGKADRAGIEAILGSTAWAASVDNALILNRTERYRLITSVQRIGPDLDETVVEMDEQTGDVLLAGSRYLVDRQLVADALFDVVTAAGADGIKRADLLAAVEGRNTTKVKALDSLVADPHISRSGTGTRNDPHVFRIDRNQKPAAPTAPVSSSLVPPIGRELETNSLISQQTRTPFLVPASVQVPEVPQKGSEVSRVRV